MKLGKLSLVAVMALGTSAFAIENVKVNGEVKVIYQTTDISMVTGDNTAVETGMFENGNNIVVAATPYNGASAGGITGTVGLTADLLKAVSAGAEVQMYTTLGLNSNVFNDNMVNADYGSDGFNTDFSKRTDDASNITQMWLATTAGKTTVKAGRMELDTPLLFTEKWNIAKNTFEGIVVVNTDLPDTTLVGAWVGKHNGHGSWNQKFDGNLSATAHEGGTLLAGSPGRTVNMHEGFRTLYTDGAYAAGAVNKSIPNTTVQAWYYNVVNIADAVWLQADAKVDIVSVGAQYATMGTKGAAEVVQRAAYAGTDDSKIWAVKGAVDVSGVNLYAAYSSTDDNGLLGFANVSTADKTKIYTGDGMIYFDGVVTAPGVDTYRLGASATVSGVKLAASYVNCEDKNNKTVDGFNVTAGTSIGALGLTAMYEQVNNEQAEVTPATTLGQPFYKGRDIDTLRLIASLKF